MATIIGCVTLASVGGTCAAAWVLRVIWPAHPIPLQVWVSAGVVVDALVLYGMLERRAPIFGRIFWRGRDRSGRVALTFDDGPNEPYTSQILDVLARSRVHATFFVIGQNVERAPAAVRRLVEDGHEIGNHTWDHGVLPLRSPRWARRQLRRTSDAVERAGGVRPTLFRAPHGWRNPFLGRAARAEGCEPVAWTLGVWDTDRPGAEAIRQRVARGLSDGGVLLLHDGRGIEPSADSSQLVDALPGIIEDARQRGLQWVTLGQLMQSATDR